MRSIREKKGLSRQRVQEDTNISQQYIGRIERGEANPTLEILWTLASAYNISIYELIGDPALHSSKLNSVVKKYNLKKEEIELMIKLITELKKKD